jgi:hypothetical protein
MCRVPHWSVRSFDQFNRDQEDTAEKVIPGRLRSVGDSAIRARQRHQIWIFFGGVRRGARGLGGVRKTRSPPDISWKPARADLQEMSSGSRLNCAESNLSQNRHETKA